MASIGLEQIKQTSTRQKVHAAIKDAILAGTLKTGEKITETDLAETFKVSRAVVREALQQLAHEGLVEPNPYRGTRIVRLSLNQLDDTIAVRLLLETESVRLAKEVITEADKKVLRSFAAKFKNAHSNQRLYAQLDLQFHEKLWEMSGNETLKKLLQQVTVPLFAMGTIIRYSKEIAPKKIHTHNGEDIHLQLIDAICDGTSEEAVEAIKEHLVENSNFRRQIFEKFLAEDSNQSLSK